MEYIGIVEKLNNLNQRVGNIELKPDVVDIVQCYDRGTDTSKTDIVHYDLSTVFVNDIVKVITDETHDGRVSYYKVIESGTPAVKSFTYVASEGGSGEMWDIVYIGSGATGTFTAAEMAKIIDHPERVLIATSDKAIVMRYTFKSSEIYAFTMQRIMADGKIQSFGVQIQIATGNYSRVGKYCQEAFNILSLSSGSTGTISSTDLTKLVANPQNTIIDKDNRVYRYTRTDTTNNIHYYEMDTTVTNSTTGFSYKQFHALQVNGTSGAWTRIIIDNMYSPAATDDLPTGMSISLNTNVTKNNYRYAHIGQNLYWLRLAFNIVSTLNADAETKVWNGYSGIQNNQVLTGICTQNSNPVSLYLNPSAAYANSTKTISGGQMIVTGIVETTIA